MSEKFASVCRDAEVGKVMLDYVEFLQDQLMGDTVVKEHYEISRKGRFTKQQAREFSTPRSVRQEQQAQSRMRHTFATVSAFE